LTNPSLQVWFKSIVCLALIPIDNVHQQFLTLKNEIFNKIFPEVVCGNYMKAFLKYFEKTYLGYMKTGMEKSPVFPVKMWNHYDNDDDRTNNRIEGDNARMKCFCGAANPNIDKAVGLLITYEASARDKYENAKKSTARAPQRNPDVASFDHFFCLCY